MQRHSGFTLIEMLITMVVIAILASIALPNYTAYITRSKIAEATTNLLSMRTKMEQYFQDTRSYVGACAAGTVAPLPPADSQKYFDITCSDLTVATYTLKATGKAGGDLDSMILSIDQANVRKTVSVPSGWALPSGNCWVSKKSGDC
jgi:type IV pilus assembly protein PilE